MIRKTRMSLLCLLTMLIFCGGAIARPVMIPKQFQKAMLVTEVDIAYKDSNHQVEIPKKVREKQVRTIGCFYDELVKNDDLLAKSCPVQSFVGKVYALKVKKDVMLFAVRLNEIQGVFDGGFLLAAYDYGKHRVSEKLLFVSTKNMDASMHGLGLEFEKILLVDAQNEVVVTEVGHNGTVYNAVIHSGFAVRKDMSFRRVLTLETQSIDPKSHSMIVRTVEGPRGKDMTVVVRSDDMTSNKKGYVVGKVFLKTDVQGDVRVVRKDLFDKTFDEVNLFNSFNEDEKFLREGYGYYAFPAGCSITR